LQAGGGSFEFFLGACEAQSAAAVYGRAVLELKE
jgi:hypothetical protein